MCHFCESKRWWCKPWICAVALIPLWRLYSESAGWAGSTACQLSRMRFLTAFCCICTCAFFANLRGNDANHEFAQWLWRHGDEIVQPWCGFGDAAMHYTTPWYALYRYGCIHRIVQSWGWEVPSLASKQKICWAWWNVCQESPVFASEWQGSALQQMWNTHFCQLENNWKQPKCEIDDQWPG